MANSFVPTVDLSVVFAPHSVQVVSEGANAGDTLATVVSRTGSGFLQFSIMQLSAGSGQFQLEIDGSTVMTAGHVTVNYGNSFVSPIFRYTTSFVLKTNNGTDSGAVLRHHLIDWRA